MDWPGSLVRGIRCIVFSAEKKKEGQEELKFRMDNRASFLIGIFCYSY